MELTDDVSCIIIYRDDMIVVYYNLESNESWVIFGNCNRCGECLPDNWIEPQIRKDIPVRPEISKIQECSLGGIYS